MGKPLPGKASERYVFIDALRGIASLAVLFHHMLHNSVMEATLRKALPGFLAAISGYGDYGVQVFFVLSGFVIAHSLRDNPLSWASVGNFALRRQFRLDPPYWFMLLVALGLQRVESMIPSLIAPPMADPGEVLLNFLYLQNLFGADYILLVAWTLCIEIQFYLAFLVLLVLGKHLTRFNGDTRQRINTGLIFFTGSFSLVSIHLTFHQAWFVQFWFYFAAGVLCYWGLKDTSGRWPFTAFLALYAFSATASILGGVTNHYASGWTMLVGLLTSLSIYVVGRKGRLTDYWNFPILQYFGRISYSLYIVHLTVLVVVLRLGYKITGENQVFAVLWFLLAGLMCIGAAHLLYLLIERPSMRFASRLKKHPESGEALRLTPEVVNAPGT